MSTGSGAPGGHPGSKNPYIPELFGLDPSISPGLARPIGWRVMMPDGSGAWDKFGPADTDWAPVGGGGPPGPLADVNLIAQANSITAGVVEVSGSLVTNYWLQDTSWAAQMCQDALTANGHFWQLRNFSSPGISTPELIAQVPTAVLPNLRVGVDNVVVLWEIINDIVYNNPSVATMEAQFLSWVSDVQAAAASLGIPPSQCRTAIGTCMPSTDLTGPQDANRLAINAWLTGGGSGADFIIDFAGDPRLQDSTNANYFDADHLHLTQNGQTVASQVGFAALIGAPVAQFIGDAIAIWEGDNTVASGGDVVSVADGSGNGNTLLASIGSVPLVSTAGFNGHKSWNFPGNATLKRVFGAPIPQTFTAYFICEGPNSPIVTAASMLLGDDPADYVALLALPTVTAGNTQNGTGLVGVSVVMVPTSQYLITMTWHAASGLAQPQTESIITVKPALVDSTTIAGTTPVVGSNSLKAAVIGGFENGGPGSLFWTNRIAAVVICNGSGQGLNRRVWAYLTQKYHFV